jgi:hypothetical protein
MRKLLIAGISCLILAGSANVAAAAVVSWNTWTSTSAGTDGTIGVTYAGPANALVASYPTYTPTATWADGTIVNNAPLPSNNILQIFGGNSSVQTLTFSQAVVNPVFAIWSLGAPQFPASFVFGQTPTFVSGGPSFEYAGGPISVVGNTVSGNEANGTIQFNGTFTQLTWTNPLFENWYGFNVGYESVKRWRSMISGSSIRKSAACLPNN